MYEVNRWFWEGALSPELCDAIINEGDYLISSDGKTGGDGEGNYNAHIRETNISFFPPGHWIEGLCLHYANIANVNSGWNMDIRYPQQVQYARYFPEQHYKPHRDDTFRSCQTEMRKLSVALQISPPENYEGGDFIIEDGGEIINMQTIEAFRTRGSVIVFPSITRHGILPITKGVRHSVVCWVVGPNYR